MMFRVELKIRDNGDYVHRFRWIDKAGQAVPIVGTLLMQIKHSPADLVAQLELSTANGLAIVDPVKTNEFTITIPRNKLLPTRPDHPYVADMLRVDGSNRYPMAEFVIEVEKGVTR